MRILSIAHSESGGGIQTVFRINNQINDKHIEITTAFESSENSYADIELKQLKSYKNPLLKLMGYFFIPQNYYAIKKALKSNSFDIIHLHGSVGLSLSVLVAINKYKSKSKVVLTAHGYGLICPNYSCFNYSENRMCTECVDNGCEFRVVKNKCDKRGRGYSLLRYLDFVIRKKVSKNYSLYDLVVTPSEFSYNLHNNSRHNFKKILVVPNPIEEKELKFDLKSKKDVITFAGRFSPEKNVEMLIEALKNVVENKGSNSLKLNILGAGPLKNTYEKMIKEYNISENVFVSEGFLNKKELNKYLEESKILVLPSICPETFGLVLFEGIRKYLIPVCLDIGAQSENVSKIGVGVLYAQNKVEYLSEAILSALSQYDYSQTKLKTANKEIDRKFSVDSYKRNIINAYEKTMNFEN